MRSNRRFDLGDGLTAAGRRDAVGLRVRRIRVGEEFRRRDRVPRVLICRADMINFENCVLHDSLHQGAASCWDIPNISTLYSTPHSQYYQTEL